MLHRRISAELSKRLTRPWTPSFCKKDNIGWSGTKPRVWHREVCVYSQPTFLYVLVLLSLVVSLSVMSRAAYIPCLTEQVQYSPSAWLIRKNSISQGARSVRRFHACPLRVPEGLGDLTKKMPKGDISFPTNKSLISVFWFRLFPLHCRLRSLLILVQVCLSLVIFELQCSNSLVKGMISQLGKYTNYNLNAFNPAVFESS